MRNAAVRCGGLLACRLPECSQLIFSSVELVAVAVADAVDGMWLWSDIAVRVLPHGPGGPVRRNNRGWTILRQPQPALREHRIFRATEQLFDIAAGVET